MTIEKLLRVSACGLALLYTLPGTSLACNEPPGYGFWITYSYQLYVNGTLELNSRQANALIAATFVAMYNSSTAGSEANTSQSTDSDGTIFFEGLATPAYWQLTDLQSGSPCYLQNLFPGPSYLFRASNVPVATGCVQSVSTATVNPSDVSVGDPVTISITASGVSTKYGNPRVQIVGYSGNGMWFNQDCPVGTNNTMTINVTPPAMGNYTVIVNNKKSNGWLYPIGGAVMTINNSGPYCTNCMQQTRGCQNTCPKCCMECGYCN